MNPRYPSRMFVIALLALAPLFLALGAQPRASAQDVQCGAGDDLVVQALERITPQSDDDAFVDALELLKHAVSVCPELGDAWYYRSLVEKRLGHDALAKYALGKAQFNGSEALDQGLNPLELSTPASRGAAESGPAPGPAAPPVPPGPIQQKWALVVGIGHFTDSEIPRLNYTTADATAFAAALEDPSIGQFPADNVHVLTDEQATTKNIKEQLNWIARHAAANDLVVIYVATHGTPRSIDTAGGANYLVTYDTEAYNGKQFNEDALYATAYPMVELANAVATRMKALRTVVFLDTCYSGAAAGPNAPAPTDKLANTAPSQAMLAHMSLGTGRIVMSASQSDEASLESSQLRHGYFTFYLLQALKNGKGMTPLSQVYASVAQQVSQSASALGKHQHPVMNRSSADADFALRAPATSAANVQP
ncbi:MAG: caspase family protein [Terracidiphilus sp.]